MKKLFAFCLSLCLGLYSCEQKNVDVQEYTLTYEVITSSGKWFGEYNDTKGTKVQTNPLELESGWKYNIKTTKLPFQMFLNATSSCVCFGTATSPDITINFYVDGKLVKTEKNNWAKGVTSIVYDVK
jgi:hypothetical protein